MNNNGQAYDTQDPSTMDQDQTTTIPEWLMAFMRAQQETNTRLEQGITQLQSRVAGYNGNNPTPFTDIPREPTSQSDTAAGPDNLGRRPKHSLTHPDKFTGDDESEFPQFKGLLEAKLEIDKEAIGTERECVWYAFGRLSGKAAGRIYPWMEATKNTGKFTTREFLEQLDAAFADPEKQAKALAKINHIRQNNKDFRDFLREFEQTLLEAQGWKWDDAVRKGYLKAAISRELKDRLVTQEEPEKYSDFVGQLRRISDRMQELKVSGPRWNRTIRYEGQRQPQYTTHPSADVMEWEPTRTTAMAGNKPLKQTQRAVSISQVERQKRRENGACVRCGSMDHWVADCPLAPAISSSNQRPQMPAYKPYTAASAIPKDQNKSVTFEELRAEDSGKE